MGIRFKLRIMLLFYSSCCIFANCNKNCITASYSFKIGVRATPDFDSINIRDTIWLDINEPTTLMSLQSGNQINFSNATYLSAEIGFQEVLSATQFRNAANDFEFKLIAGSGITSTNPQLLKDYILLEQNGRYIFRLGVIPKTIGVYRLVFVNAANVFRNNSNCEKASFQFDFQNTNQHFYLYPGGAGTSRRRCILF